MVFHCFRVFRKIKAVYVIREELNVKIFAFKRICHLQILIGVLYMQLLVCTALVLSCFFVYSFVYLFDLLITA